MSNRSNAIAAAALAVSALIAGPAFAADGPFGLNFQNPKYAADITAKFVSLDKALVDAQCDVSLQFEDKEDKIQSGLDSSASTRRARAAAINAVKSLRQDFLGTTHAHSANDHDGYQFALNIAEMKLKGAVRSGLKPRRCYHFNVDVIAGYVAKQLHSQSPDESDALKKFCDARDNLNKQIKAWGEDKYDSKVLTALYAADIKLLKETVVPDLEAQLRSLKECPKAWADGNVR